MWQRRQSQESPEKSLMLSSALRGDCGSSSSPLPPTHTHHVQVRARLGSCCLPRWQFSRIPSTLPRWAFSWHFSIHSFPLSFIHKLCMEPLLRGRRRQKQRRPSCKGAGGRWFTSKTPSPQARACTSTAAQLGHNGGATQASSIQKGKRGASQSRWKWNRSLEDF